MVVAYVLKRYPRYSETFIVNEILAHEAAGLQIEIFSLLPPNDTHFQSLIPCIKAPVNYLLADPLKGVDLWDEISKAGAALPGLWNRLEIAGHEDGRHVYQAVLLAKTIQKKGIGHIHSHFATAATTVARLASYFAGVPYSFTAHAKDIYHQDVRFAELERKLCDASCVVTVSDFNVRYLRELYGASAANVSRIYNGLDLNRFTYDSAEERPAEIMTVGRLVEKKGFPDLIEACRILKNAGKVFRCGIIGEGEMEQDLRAQIERLNLIGIVELLGPLPQDEVMRRIRNSAVFAAPCVIGSDGNRDGLPTVLLEAMALGTPCISTDVTGIPEVIQDGVTGLIVGQRKPHELAAAILRLMEDAELRVHLASSARRLVELKFDIHRNTAGLRSLFENPQTTLELRNAEVLCD